MELLNKNRFIENSKKSILDQYSNNEPISLNIVVINEKLYKEDSGFGVYYCIEANSEDLLINKFYIKGLFAAKLIPGQTYEVSGNIITYENDAFKEKQINVTRVKAIRPLNKYGIIKYLQSIKGLKNRAELIYDKYGDESINILINDPIGVSKEIHGVGKKSALNWAKQLEAFKDSQDTVSKLLEFGLSYKQCKKLYANYGDEILMKIEQNPYVLAKEVPGFGFKSADRIARNMNYDFESNSRISEAIIYALEEASISGNCFLPCKILIKQVQEILSLKLSINEMIELSQIDKTECDYKINNDIYKINIVKLKSLLAMYYKEKKPSKKELYRYVVREIDECNIILQFEDLKLENRITIDTEEEEPKIYLTYLFVNEKKVAAKIASLIEEKDFPKEVDNIKLIDKYLEVNKIQVEERQKEAIIKATEKDGGFIIIDGPAGSGKTFVLNIILKILSLIYKYLGKTLKVSVLAPTGKAAKVATNSTKIKSSTVHKKLGYGRNGQCKYNEDNQFDSDVIVLDESSMIDIVVCRYLLDAIKKGTKVIFLGDIHQLPSVGPGNVLKDIIATNVVKVVSLNVVKRQNLLSGVLKNAIRILNKEMIQTCHDTKDAYVIIREDVYQVQKLILDSIENLMTNKGVGFDEIQVLCPQKTSCVGKNTMNYLIQERFNPSEPKYKVKAKTFEIMRGSNLREEVTLYFKKGDKVIHTKNNNNIKWYKKSLNNKDFEEIEDLNNITNGETGVVDDVIKVDDGKNGFLRIIVKYDDGYVFYDDTEGIEHANALTIHKSQGSQWKAVIIPIVKQNYLQLDNNLFYTAYTRATTYCVTIGQNAAFRMAINNCRITNRYTNLKNNILKQMK